MDIMQLPRTLAVGMAATIFGLAGCASDPSGPGSGPPVGGDDDTAIGGPGAGAIGGSDTSASGAAGTASTGVSNTTGGEAELVGTAGEGEDSGGTLGTGVSNTTGGEAELVGTAGEGEDSGGAASAGDYGTGGNSAGGSGMVGSDTVGSGTAGSGTGGSGTGGGDSSGGNAADRGQGGSGGQADTGRGGASVSDPNCPAGAFLCEGFEAYAVGSPPEGGWTREGGAFQEDGPGSGGTDVDTMYTFSGEKALHVTGKLPEDQSSIKKTLDLEDPVTFVRLMIYTVNYPDQNIHTRIVSLGTEREKETYSLGTWNAVAIEKVNSVYLQNDDNRFGQASFENRWVCWEFEIDQTGGMGKVKPTIWLDGKELSLRKAGSASHGGTTDSWDPIDFKYIWVGLFGYQRSNESYDYWVDDLIVHSERIGCPDAE